MEVQQVASVKLHQIGLLHQSEIPQRTGGAEKRLSRLGRHHHTSGSQAGDVRRALKPLTDS